MTFKFGYAIAVVAALTLAPVTASAHDNGYNHRHQSSNGDNQLVGGIIGAVAGGVIGSQVAGNGARTEGSVLGAVIGGVAGAAIAGDSNQSRTYGSQVQYNNGYYRQPTYTQSYQTYPAAPTYHSSHTTYYAPQPTYYAPTTYYPAPTYYAPQPYYGSTYYTRPSVSINVGTGGYYGGNRGYYQRSAPSRRHNHSRRRGR